MQDPALAGEKAGPCKSACDKCEAQCSWPMARRPPQPGAATQLGGAAGPGISETREGTAVRIVGLAVVWFLFVSSSAPLDAQTVPIGVGVLDGAFLSSPLPSECLKVHAESAAPTAPPSGSFAGASHNGPARTRGGGSSDRRWFATTPLRVVDGSVLPVGRSPHSEPLLFAAPSLRDLVTEPRRRAVRSTSTARLPRPSHPPLPRHNNERGSGRSGHKQATETRP